MVTPEENLVFPLAFCNLGVDRDERILGVTRDGVKKQALAHAQEVHAALFTTMNTPEQLAGMEWLIAEKIK